MEAYDDLGASGRLRPDGPPGLVLLYAPGFERLPPAFVLRADEVYIGREAPAEILIPQPAVSRRHARITRDAFGWALTDLGARNGTLVNGAFVDQVRLRQDDEIRIGDGFFKFVDADAAGYLPYRIDGTVLSAPATPSGIVGGYQLATIATALERIAKSEISVLIMGESGSGKEVFARQVHAWSERRGAFCALNCAAIPATLLESELFGYRRGAFSGADRDHVGLVRAADGGTLFLDEVGDLPVEAQAKLLRVLQTKEVLPLGAMAPEQVDVRVVCATHQDLAAMQRDGRFRADLFGRLNEYAVTLPPLREHKEDIYALCRAFLARHKRPDLVLSVPYLTGLLHYDFPYNVRELEALIKRGVALAEGGVLGAEHLSEEIHAAMTSYGARARPAGDAPAGPRLAAAQATPPSPSWPPPPGDGAAPPHLGTTARMAPTRAVGDESTPGSTAPTAEQLRDALARHRGNVAAVGREFGKERMQVHRWMKRYGIDPNDFR
ncbi:MAG: sigma 54-interacting transcriptional regulator [Deltaproteobacteria bacterium]|jgi:transcriptional regulator with GAF, ATPase, and Fis domain|nr:sigma 54-interacting transcriptional regulator [Deltaproteobacteria bacterium]MBW2535572.1 sigma 54-interacting transcriptional regulator [Deltaproteobacteria bacterium]